MGRNAKHHQVVEGEVCDSIPQNGLLDEQHIGPAGSDLLYHLQDVIALLLQDPVGQSHLRLCSLAHTQS